MSDPVDHPVHYTSYAGLEVIDLTEQMNFNRGNAVKYVARAGLKDGSDEGQDLKKAIWYLRRELQRIGMEVTTSKGRPEPTREYRIEMKMYSPDGNVTSSSWVSSEELVGGMENPIDNLYYQVNRELEHLIRKSFLDDKTVVESDGMENPIDNLYYPVNRELEHLIRKSFWDDKTVVESDGMEGSE